MGSRSQGERIVVYIGLGSNLGDRQANLREAVERIEQLGLEIIRTSSIYETEPVGMRQQPWFLNQVIETSVFDELRSRDVSAAKDSEVAVLNQAQSILSALLEIERVMGRKRSLTNGPRLIDIDLLLFGGEIIVSSPNDEDWSSASSRNIIVPHPGMHERRFVLEPLCELVPDLVHPVLKRTCRELLDLLDARPEVRPYAHVDKRSRRKYT